MSKWGSSLRAIGSAAVFAGAGGLERVAVGADLQALGDWGEAELGGNGGAIPFHERGADLEDLVAVHADDLGDLRVVALVGQVVFEIFADIDLPEQGALDHDGQGAIDGGAGDGVVDGAGVVEGFLGGEVLLLRKGRLEYGQALVGHPQAFGAEVGLEFGAGGVVAPKGYIPPHWHGLSTRCSRRGLWRGRGLRGPAAGGINT